jgi:hypothetical protein
MAQCDAARPDVQQKAQRWFAACVTEMRAVQAEPLEQVSVLYTWHKQGLLQGVEVFEEYITEVFQAWQVRICYVDRPAGMLSRNKCSVSKPWVE